MSSPLCTSVLSPDCSRIEDEINPWMNRAVGTAPAERAQWGW